MICGKSFKQAIFDKSADDLLELAFKIAIVFVSRVNRDDKNGSSFDPYLWNEDIILTAKKIYEQLQQVPEWEED